MARSWTRPRRGVVGFPAADGQAEHGCARLRTTGCCSTMGQGRHYPSCYFVSLARGQIEGVEGRQRLGLWTS